MRRNFFILFVPIILFSCFIWLGIKGLSQDSSIKTRVSAVGRNVPDFEIPMLDSIKKLTKSDVTGKKTLVNFFASWCAPCIAEHDFLFVIKQKTDIPIIGIAYKDKEAAIKKYLEEHDNPFAKIALDRDGRWSIDWGVTGVPETFLISADGVILAHFAGPLNQDVWDREFKELAAR